MFGKRIQSIFVGMAAAVAMAGSAQAGLVNDVPSCYAATHIAPDTHPYDRMLYVLLDQTVLLDPQLQQSVVNNTMRLLTPGTKFAIAEFSAYSQGRYLDVLRTGIIEKPLAHARVNETPMKAAARLAQCIDMQRNFASKIVVTTLAQVLKASTSSLDQSDIMQAFKTVSPVVAQDPAAQKVVFVVTDALENSSVSSFYAHGAVRLVNPEAELAKAKAADMLGDFGGARVYLLGAALMPPPDKGTKAQRDGYRDPRILHALSAFWHGYFKASNANLVEFGEPALVEPTSFQ